MCLEGSQTEALQRQLEHLQRDFICNTSLPAASVSVQFQGNFLGERVVWDMTLATLASHRDSLAAPASLPCPFIQIDAGVNGVYPILVGLDLPCIDEPAIRKTIIMVRNYKRLRIGTIEFCPPAPAA